MSLEKVHRWFRPLEVYVYGHLFQFPYHKTTPKTIQLIFFGENKDEEHLDIAVKKSL